MEKQTMPRLAVDNMPQNAIVRGWIHEARAQLHQARLGGDPSCIAAARVAFAEAMGAARACDPKPALPYIIHCAVRGCEHAGSARSEGLAVRWLAEHIVTVHLPQPVEVA